MRSVRVELGIRMEERKNEGTALPVICGVRKGQLDSLQAAAEHNYTPHMHTTWDARRDINRGLNFIIRLTTRPSVCMNKMISAAVQETSLRHNHMFFFTRFVYKKINKIKSSVKRILLFMQQEEGKNGSPTNTGPWPM